MDRRDLMEISSMDKWYPSIEKIEEVKTPKTRKIELEQDKITDCPTEKIQNNMLQLGSTVFMRTDAASNKHRMEKSSKIQERDKEIIQERYHNLVQFNMSHMLPFKTIYLRGWLNLKHRFKAFEGTPIAEELRFFIHNGEVINYHFYWPEESIKDTDTQDWKIEWLKTKRSALDNRAEAVRQAGKVAEVFRGQGFWSVDFARTEQGEWICIDMAKGEVSWMPEKPEPTVKVGEYEEKHGDLDVRNRVKAVTERISELED